MASYKYTYPRVDITTTAISRPVLTENVPDTLVLFAPIVANIGPVDQVVICHNRAEFEQTFGTIDYSLQGQNGLNILHWLTNGGTVYAFRLSGDGAKPATAAVTNSSNTLNFTTKYVGDGYDSFKIKLQKYSSNKTMAYIYNGSLLLERFIIDENSFESLKDSNNTVSEYVYINTTGSTMTFANLTSAVSSTEVTVGFDGGDNTTSSLDELLAAALTVSGSTESNLRKILKDSLQYPIDVILDAGFVTATKKAIWNAFNAAETGTHFIRNDVFVYYDAYEITDTSVQPLIPTNDSFYASIDGGTNPLRSETSNAQNAAVYQQYYKVSDPFTQSQIFVTPSYFISTLLPQQTIALNKGYHTPIAGLTNGELSGVLYVNENPIPETKETWFTNRVNYSEKDSRQISFMSQRTLEYGSKNTALQFINNSLMTNKIVKELGTLAREYLFEYNDAITLANIRKTLNTYISNYVASRVLEYAVIDVQKNPFSTEAIDVQINIKYTGTIEVISIDLTIE